MIDVNQPIAVTLSANQWNVILMQLAQGPWAQVNDLINEIRGQCVTATQDSKPAQEAAVTQLRPVPGLE